MNLQIGANVLIYLRCVSSVLHVLRRISKWFLNSTHLLSNGNCLAFSRLLAAEPQTRQPSPEVKVSGDRLVLVD